jgi:uncharacterized membrane protein (DUF373 family)
VNLEVGDRDTSATHVRKLVSRAFGLSQDVVYVALGALLAVSAAAVLVHGGIDLIRAVMTGVDLRAIILLLDRILLALMIVELLYTVQVSFREHTLVPEPFVLVALIATVRRILVITAEFGAQTDVDPAHFRLVMLELALLTVLIVVLVGSLVTLRRSAAAPHVQSHK